MVISEMKVTTCIPSSRACFSLYSCNNLQIFGGEARQKDIKIKSSLKQGLVYQLNASTYSLMSLCLY